MAYAFDHSNGPACTCQYGRPHADADGTLSRFLSNAGRAIWDAAERRAQRRMLLELDSRQLSDIGVTRKQAEREAAKSYWE